MLGPWAVRSFGGPTGNLRAKAEERKALLGLLRGAVFDLCLREWAAGTLGQDPTSYYDPLILTPKSRGRARAQTHTHTLLASLICWCIYDLMKVYPLGKRLSIKREI